jgi:hypothetical protein
MTKNQIAAWIRQKLTAEVIAAFVLGVVLGLVVLGWWVWPVQWTNSNPSDLKAVYKDSYMQLIADSYSLSNNAAAAQARLQELKGPGEKDSDLTTALDRLAKARLTTGDAVSAARLQQLALVLGVPQGPTPQPGARTPGAAGWIWAGSISRIGRFIGIVFFLLVLVVGVSLLLLQLRKQDSMRRRRSGPSRQPPPDAPRVDTQVAAPHVSEGSLGRFETTFTHGDESYDVNYSIETSSGEFLGECGISAVESSGVSQPDAVAAFEVWLFDKDDVRTETRVLVSERAFENPVAREKLTGKGELIRAELGQVVTLETANLRLDATVIDMAYASGSDAGVFANLASRLEVSHR